MNNPTDDTNLTPEEKARKRNDIQRETVMTDSDYRKKISEKTVVESEIRKLKRQESQIKVDILDRQNHLKHIDQDIVIMETQLKTLKKKMNLII